VAAAEFFEACGDTLLLALRTDVTPDDAGCAENGNAKVAPAAMIQVDTQHARFGQAPNVTVDINRRASSAA
jgi:hypothetical protein